MLTPSHDLQHMVLFVEVARLRNFSRAAAALGLSTATLSRRIAAFEQQVGTRLFDRTTRRVEPTSAGVRHLLRCAPLVDAARRAHEALRSEAEQPAGHLRLSMPVDLGVALVGPQLPQFASLYPGVSFEIDLSPRHRDLVGEPVDVALRLGTVREPGLVSRRVGWLHQGLYASPCYLQRSGEPAHPADLDRHDCIFVGAGDRSATWRFEREHQRALTVTVSGRYSVNNHGLMRTLAECDAGVAALAPALCSEAIAAGRLLPVLDAWTVPRLAVHAVTTSRLQTATVRAFIRFVTERLATP
ncbi:MAG: LysR family transcriptional regulator [Rubrivivax sp.]